MGYSTGIFSDFGPFLKMVVTQKIEVRISSKLATEHNYINMYKKM